VPSKSVASVAPVASTRVAVTGAGALSVYEIVLESSTPSPFGVRTSGTATRPVSLNGGGFAPSVPVAGRTPGPAPIIQKYRPFGAVEASHVQQTEVPPPAPVPNAAPRACVLVTVHGSLELSRPGNVPGPAIVPLATG